MRASRDLEVPARSVPAGNIREQLYEDCGNQLLGEMRL